MAGQPHVMFLDSRILSKAGASLFVTLLSHTGSLIALYVSKAHLSLFPRPNCMIQGLIC